MSMESLLSFFEISEVGAGVDTTESSVVNRRESPYFKPELTTGD